MEITNHNPAPQEPTTSLGALSQGQVFRFACMTYGEALDQGAFYMKLMSSAPKGDGAYIVCLKDGNCLIRDTDHRVVVHKSQLLVTP